MQNSTDFRKLLYYDLLNRVSLININALKKLQNHMLFTYGRSFNINKKEYFINDRVIIPDDIKNMSKEELDKEIKRLKGEKNKMIHNNKTNNSDVNTNILSKIMKENFAIEPFEVINLYWNFGPFNEQMAGDFFFDENYNLKCSGLAGIVNTNDYISYILTGKITAMKTNRMVSEDTIRQVNVVPNEKEKIAIDYAKACNMNYLIQNSDGRFYATYEKPQKDEQARWKMGSKFILIRIPISFLSSTDEEPYFIGNKNA